MKANRHKGSGRPGAAIRYVTVKIKKAASYAGEKIHKTFRINTNYSFDRHQNIMQDVYNDKYNGNDIHYRKQAAYYANR
jgi:hypothetical protein